MPHFHWVVHYMCIQTWSLSMYRVLLSVMTTTEPMDYICGLYWLSSGWSSNTHIDLLYWLAKLLHSRYKAKIFSQFTLNNNSSYSPNISIMSIKTNHFLHLMLNWMSSQSLFKKGLNLLLRKDSQLNRCGSNILITGCTYFIFRSFRKEMVRYIELKKMYPQKLL